MRQVINGSGQNTTNFVTTALLGNQELILADLYLIGDPSSSHAVWLTDWSTPLLWSAWGKFYPAVTSRGSIKSQIGLEVTTMDFEWTPSSMDFTGDIATTSPYQKAWLGVYDGVPFRSWTCYMPTPGDANTYGASELFGGRIGNVTISRGSIKFSVTSFLDVINQMVPGPVVESTNPISGFKGASGPGGTNIVPNFTVTTASQNQVNGSGGTFAVGDFTDGFLYMTSGQLKGMWSVITGNSATLAGVTTFNLSMPFPWSPALGDTFYASSVYPLDKTTAGANYFGFPFVPAPETAV